jgi:ABC-type lipoprotein export system ATPase subunit
MLLEVRNVSKSFQNPGGIPRDVLRNVNLSVDAGQGLAIVGPSGSGKSTLLNLIGALDRPDQGTICIEGRPLTGLDDSELARIRNRYIGFVFQLHHLLPQCTVLENVLIPTLAEGRSNADAIHRARQLLQRVGLDEFENHRPGQLSGGQRQRAAVVRALINKPKILLADEPTGSLDASTADQLADLLVEISRAENLAMIVVTHSERLARRLKKIFRLDNGALTDITHLP